MDSKIYSLVITSILSFVLIVGIPKIFENDINAQEDGTTDITPGEDMKRINQVKKSESRMVQGQFNRTKNDGNKEE
ncbi:MAG: hypothetical protein ACRD6U_01380 [Nitrososphaeraceae archaeon]